MALQCSPEQNAVVCNLKRNHEAISMFSNIDWLDQVVADVSKKKPCHAPSVTAPAAAPTEKKAKPVEPCLQEFFTNMLRSRGYPATTHSTLSCGYSNKPTVSLFIGCILFVLCTIMSSLTPSLSRLTAISNIKLRHSFHRCHTVLQSPESQRLSLHSQPEPQCSQQIWRVCSSRSLPSRSSLHLSLAT